MIAPYRYFMHLTVRRHSREVVIAVSEAITAGDAAASSEMAIMRRIWPTLAVGSQAGTRRVAA
ncbi:MAG: hypothetical protein ACRDTD_08040 [Pseudonocardiaceae bacterium]